MNDLLDGKNGPSAPAHASADNQNQLADPLHKISQLTKIPINTILDLFSNITSFPVLDEQGLAQNGGGSQLPSQPVHPDC